MSLRDIAALIEAELCPTSAAEHLIEDVIVPPEQAQAQHLIFVSDPAYLSTLQTSQAGAVILDPKYRDHPPKHMAKLLVANSYWAFATVCGRFHPAPTPNPGTHPWSFVHPEARVHPSATLEPGAVVMARASIAAHAIIGAGAVIDHDVVIGESSRVGANAYVGFATVGAHCQLHPGSRVGTRGFGFTRDPKSGGYIDVPQLGGVRIGNRVEIGANTTIDRGTIKDTVIEDDCRLDNLVQVAHNVIIGKGSVLVAQVGIAGSTKLEPFVQAGGQVGMAGHLTIGEGAQIAAQSGVMRDLEPGAKVAGSPAIAMRTFLRLHNKLMRWL